MGYTHYYRQNKHATPEQWEAICNDFRKLRVCAFLDGATLPIQREEGDTSAPLIDDSIIIFNGIGDDAHETMVLEREGDGFQFCKTNQKPYDSAVIALLVLAHHHAPDVWEISSDGSPEEWQPVVDWMNTLGMGEFESPLKSQYEEDDEDDA